MYTVYDDASMHIYNAYALGVQRVNESFTNEVQTGAGIKISGMRHYNVA